MDRALARLAPAITIGAALCLLMPMCEGGAFAAGLTAKDTAKAKQARELYKGGQYEAAAEVYLRLSSDNPDMLVFTRNLGACYYYLRRPEPALSNLREYLRRSLDITQEDRSEVEGWIAEMDNLRHQPAAAPSTAPTVPVEPPLAGDPSPIPAETATPAPAAPIAPAVAGTQTSAPAAPPAAARALVAAAAPSSAGPAATQPAPQTANVWPQPSAPAAPPWSRPTVTEPTVSPPLSLADSGKVGVSGEALDLRQKPAGEIDTTASQSSNYWWLWTGIGVLVAGGIATAVVLSTRSHGRDGTCSSGLNGCIVVGQ